MLAEGDSNGGIRKDLQTVYWLFCLYRNKIDPFYSNFIRQKKEVLLCPEKMYIQK